MRPPPMVRSSGVSAYALGVLRAVGFAGEFRRALGDDLLEARAGHQLVDQVPVDRPPAAHAFRGGAEEIGVVVADLPLVDQPGQPAGPGENREQRELGQRDRRGAVVDQHDVVAGQRQLIAAARRGAVDRADIALVRVAGGVLDPVPCLVGELAEIDLVGVRRLAEHVDVGAGAEHPRLVGGDDDAADFGVLETQALDRVVELDVDPEVVGVELERIARHQGRGLVDVHREPRDIAVGAQLPVAIGIGMGLDVDPTGVPVGAEIASGFGHCPSPVSCSD